MRYSIIRKGARYARACILFVLSQIALTSFGSEQGRNCGTHWTGWGEHADSTVNPCPAGCARDERLSQRTHAQDGKLLYDEQYQCRFPPLFTGLPLIKGSPADPDAARGAWIDWEDGSRLTGSPAEIRSVWEPDLGKLADLIRQSPALADMGGYFPKMRVSVDGAAKPVATGDLYIEIWPPEAIYPATDVGRSELRIKPDYLGRGPGGFSLTINHLPTGGSGGTRGLDRMDWYHDDLGEFFLLPEADRKIAGFPVLAGYLWVTAAGKRPLFLPVSQERALKAAIVATRAQIEQATEIDSTAVEILANYNSPEMREIRKQAIDAAGAGETDPERAAAARAKAQRDDLEQERQIRELAQRPAEDNPLSREASAAAAALEAQLDGLSPADRGSPAFSRVAPESFLHEEITAAATPDTIALMAYNPEFFDTKLAPGTMQLLLMSIGSVADWEDQDVQPQQQPLQVRVPIAIIEQTDWREAARLLR